MKYLVSNFDVQRENNDDEQVVKDADRRCQGRRHMLSRTPTQVVKDTDSSDDDVSNLECNVADVGKIQPQVFRRGCRDVVPDITQQR